MLKIRDILFVSLLFVSIPSTLGHKEFCKSFVGNNNSIDYGFQLETNKEDYSLVIGSEFWKVKWTGDHAQLENGFESKTSHLFNSQYFVAFGGAPCSQPVCQTNHYVKAGFLLKNVNSIDWDFIDINTFNRSVISPLLTERNQIGEIRIHFNPSVGYSIYDKLYLLQQTPIQKGSGTVFSTTYRAFSILEKGKIHFDQTYNKTEYRFPIEAVFSKDGNYSIRRYLYLLKDNLRILYCITKAFRGIGECTPNANQILINCGIPQLRPLPTTGATASNFNSMSTFGGTTPKVNPLSTTGATASNFHSMSTFGGTAPKVNPLPTTGATASNFNSMSTFGGTAPKFNSLPTTETTQSKPDSSPPNGDQTYKPYENPGEKNNPLSTTRATTSGSLVWLGVILILAVCAIVLVIGAVLYCRQKSAPKDDLNMDSKQPQSGVPSQGSGQDRRAPQPAQNEAIAGEDGSLKAEKSSDEMSTQRSGLKSKNLETGTE